MSDLIDLLVPAEQEGSHAVVRGWLRQLGDTVAADEPLVELETDKVTQEVPAPSAGVLIEILLPTDSEATPGAILGRLRVLSLPSPEPQPVPSPPKPVIPAPSAAQVLSPAVRRVVADHGIDPASVPGTGRDGRVTRADIDAAVAARGTPAIHSIPHDRMRRSIAEHLQHSLHVAPHVTAVFEADFTAVIAHRRRHQADFEQRGAKLTYTAYLAAAAAAAMQAAPAVNSRWHDDRLDVFTEVNIGIGTALGDKGLVVPVIQHAHILSLEQIACQLADLTERARANRLTPADMRGGTFSISNYGVSGSLLAAPIIINQPQSAILGIGKLEKRVVVRVVDGVDSIQIRPMCYVSLTIDHRVIDAHQTNAWLTAFVQSLERWPGDEPRAAGTAPLAGPARPT